MARTFSYAVGQTRIVEIPAETEHTSIGVRSFIQYLMMLNRAGEPVKEPAGVEELLKEALPLSGAADNVVPLRPNKIRINLFSSSEPSRYLSTIISKSPSRCSMIIPTSSCSRLRERSTDADPMRRPLMVIHSINEGSRGWLNTMRPSG